MLNTFVQLAVVFGLIGLIGFIIDLVVVTLPDLRKLKRELDRTGIEHRYDRMSWECRYD